MIPRIRQLNANVVNKIAAGEVIERPASVVKELLENSVDALSTRIEVDIADGGAELIRVIDDGDGIDADDLLLAVTSHATSKIASDADLFSVQTMGFRGEALASIAAVSRFRIRSRRADVRQGNELEVSGGEISNLRSCPGPVGTLIEVRQLFANTPVRRRFLRKTTTEVGHVSEQFSRIAIACPRLHMVLRHNGKLIHELPPTDRLIDRLQLFHGSDLTEKLIEVRSETVAGFAGGESIRLWGYVGHPGISKSTRRGQYLYLNGRWIQDRSLQHALGEAYRGLLMSGRHPVAFLFLELPPHLVDVNVHPTKSEVRFRDGQALYRQLLSTLRNRFLSLDLGGDFKLPQRPAAPPAAVTGGELQLKLAEFVPEATTTAGSAVGSSEAQRRPSFPETGLPVTATSGVEELGAVSPVSLHSGVSRTGENPVQAVPTGGSVPIGGDSGSTVALQTARADTPSEPHSSALRAFQIHDCYIVVADEAGLTVIDQHALHERILYEHLRERVLSGAIESQRMLVPDAFEFSPRDAAVLAEHRSLLSELGFEIEEFGGNSMLLSSYPVMLSRANREQLIRDIVEQLDQPAEKPDQRDIMDSVLHMMSCRAAIKAGRRLTREEMESLLEQRHLVDDSHHCPHGRPTSLVVSRGTLDKQFGRLG